MAYETRVRGRYYATIMKSRRLHDVVPSRSKLTAIENLVEDKFPGGQWIGGRVLGEYFYKVGNTLITVHRH